MAKKLENQLQIQLEQKSETIPFKTRYENHDESDYGITFSEPSLTQQQFKDETDINNIVNGMARNGVMPQYMAGTPIYGDFTDAGDYQEALNLVMHAREQFDALPSGVREKFMNDPARFYEFANNPKNEEALVDMGLATWKEEYAPKPLEPAPAAELPPEDVPPQPTVTPPTRKRA